MNSIDRIRKLYETHGASPYGEDISQVQHAVQVARLAELNNADDAMIAAALLHDIGHLMYSEELLDWEINDRHEVIGASLLRPVFGLAVAEPVKLHVMAKRYLCAIDPSYYEGLSDASRKSLELQGGAALDPHKKAFFERNPYFIQAIDLRLWDDEGKNSDDQNADFDAYVPLLRSLLTNGPRHYPLAPLRTAVR